MYISHFLTYYNTNGKQLEQYTVQYLYFSFAQCPLLKHNYSLKKILMNSCVNIYAYVQRMIV